MYLRSRVKRYRKTGKCYVKTYVIVHLNGFGILSLASETFLVQQRRKNICISTLCIKFQYKYTLLRSYFKTGLFMQQYTFMRIQ